jgi:hypothetical protein
VKANLLCQRVSLRTSSGVARAEKLFVCQTFIGRFSPVSSIFPSFSHHFSGKDWFIIIFPSFFPTKNCYFLLEDQKSIQGVISTGCRSSSSTEAYERYYRWMGKNLVKNCLKLWLLTEVGVPFW